jgi:hypothetical protein
MLRTDKSFKIKLKKGRERKSFHGINGAANRKYTYREKGRRRRRNNFNAKKSKQDKVDICFNV